MDSADFQLMNVVNLSKNILRTLNTFLGILNLSTKTKNTDKLIFVFILLHFVTPIVV